MPLPPHLSAAVAELRALGWTVIGPKPGAALSWRRDGSALMAGSYSVFLVLRPGESKGKRYELRHGERLHGIYWTQCEALTAAEQIAAAERAA